MKRGKTVDDGTGPEKLNPNLIELSPERIRNVRREDVRVLTHMLNHRLGRAAMMHPHPHDFLLAEIYALDRAVATLNELLDGSK